MAAKKDFVETVAKVIYEGSGRRFQWYQVATQLKTNKRTPYARTARALMQLIWDDQIQFGVQIDGGSFADKQPYYTIVYSHTTLGPLYSAEGIRHEPESRRAPAPLTLPEEKFEKLPLYIRVPLWLSRFPDGLTSQQVADAMKSKPAGFSERQLNAAVYDGHARLNIQRTDDPRGKFEFVYVPHDGWQPTVADYVRPRMTCKRHAKPIKARILEFLTEQLEEDGEILGYTPVYMNRVVDAASGRDVLKRCDEMVRDGVLVREPLAVGTFLSSANAYFKLGYRHWLLWTVKQRVKEEVIAREKFGEPMLVDSDLEVE